MEVHEVHAVCLRKPLTHWFHTGPCCPGGRPGGPYASQDSEDSTTDLVKPPRPARSRRSLGASPIGRRNSDVAALAMRRTGSEIDVANFGACCDGSPVPAIGFDEAPRTP